jgi:hypothetical protein
VYNGRNADTYNGAFPEVRTLLDVPADAEGADGRSEKFCRYESGSGTGSWIDQTALNKRSTPKEIQNAQSIQGSWPTKSIFLSVADQNLPEGKIAEERKAR